MIKGFTWGTFSLVHKGHLHLFQDIKSFCDELHIILIPDNEVLNNKKYSPPDWNTRKNVLLKRIEVDFVHYDSYNLGLRSVLRYEPEYFILGYDQQSRWEQRLISFIRKHELRTEIVRSRMFAGGLHSSDIRRHGQHHLFGSNGNDLIQIR